MTPSILVTYKQWFVLGGVCVIAGVSGFIGYTAGSVVSLVPVQAQIIQLTNNLGKSETALATCNGAILTLEQATMSAGRAREQAESLALELTKRNQRVVKSAAAIQASGCVEMVNKLLDVKR